MFRFISRLVTHLASYASIFGLYFTVAPPTSERSTFEWWLLAIGFLLAAVTVYIEIDDFVRSGPKFFRKQQAINDYMRRWVSQSGRVVIFSRDMSWAMQKPVRDVLLEKASRNELIVCVERDIQLTNELHARGAQIVTYGQIGHVPKSRFTIVGYEREGARVAVGVSNNGQHVIQEFQSGSHPFFAVAEDLVKLLIAAKASGANVS